MEEPCQCSECKFWLGNNANLHDVVIAGEVTQDALDDWVRDGEGEEEQEERSEKADRLREDAYEQAHLSYCETCDNSFHMGRGNINVRSLDEMITSRDARDVYSVCSLCQRRPDVRNQLRRDPLWEDDDEHAAARQLLERVALQAVLEPLVRQIEEQQRRNVRGDPEP